MKYRREFNHNGRRLMAVRSKHNPRNFLVFEVVEKLPTNVSVFQSWEAAFGEFQIRKEQIKGES